MNLRGVFKNLVVLTITFFGIQSGAKECLDLFSELKNATFEQVDVNQVIGAVTKSSSSSTYHVMPRLFQNGLNGVKQSLKEFKKMGVHAIWLGPVHPQTIPHLNEWPNDHGYWVSDHSAVDEKLGGEVALIQLIQSAHKMGIKIYLDTPINHYGYGDEVIFNQQLIKVSEHPELFLQSRSLVDEDFRSLEVGEGSDTEILEKQEEIASLRLAGLNDLNHRNPEVQKYLIESYKKFIDLGIDGFRIDAVKHLPREFTAQFINELQVYSSSRDKKLDFVLELLIHNARSMNVVSKNILDQISEKDKVFFIDFPLQGEVRKSVFEGSFVHLKGFLDYRRSISERTDRFVPMPDDHDMAKPINDSFKDLLVTALSQFLSSNPGIIHHGSEISGSETSNRPEIDSVNADGDIAKLKNKIERKIAEMDLMSSKPEILLATDNMFVVKKTGGSKAIVLFVNKSDNPSTFNLNEFNLNKLRINIEHFNGTKKIETFFSYPDGAKILKLNSRSFALIEFK